MHFAMRPLLIDAAGAIWVIAMIYAVVLLGRISGRLDQIARRLDELSERPKPEA
jgi:hypothetical protein